VAALERAKFRGVEVRVLIDAVGARYSVPSILPTLREKGIVADVFNGNVIMGLRLPYANLRTHRKILVVDGRIAFSGGMNIREGFTLEFGGEKQSHDTHFRISGPVPIICISVMAIPVMIPTGTAEKTIALNM